MIAKAAGQDVKTLMKYYEHIGLRERSRETTSFEISAKSKTLRR